MRRSKGTGSIVQIHGKYKARWTINGKRVYGEPRATRDEAERDRILAQPSEDDPIIPHGEIPTFQTFAQVCQAGRYGQKIAASTRNTNETFRLVHIEGSPLGKKRMNKITRADCQAWVDDLRAHKHRMEDGKRIEWEEQAAPATIRRMAGFVSAIFNLGVKEGYCKANPMAGLELPKVEERENRVLTLEEAEKLLRPTDRIGTMIFVALMTGMERSTLRILQWGDVQPDKILIRGTKNNYRKAPVPCTPEVYAAIQAMPKRSMFVFTTESGKPMSERNIDRDFRLRANELGLPKEMRLHDMRGSFATFLIDQGENPKVVQRLLRHANVQTTLKQYARSVHSSETAAIENLSLRFKPKTKAEEKKA